MLGQFFLCCQGGSKLEEYMCLSVFAEEPIYGRVYLPPANLRKKESSQFLRKSNILKGNVFASLLKARLDKKYSSHFARKYFELKVSGNFLFHFTFLYLYFFYFIALGSSRPFRPLHLTLVHLGQCDSKSVTPPNRHRADPPS